MPQFCRVRPFVGSHAVTRNIMWAEHDGGSVFEIAKISGGYASSPTILATFGLLGG